MRIEWWVSHHLSPYLRCAILNLEASRQIRMQLLQNVVTHLYRLFSNQLMATISDFYPISHQLFLFLSLTLSLSWNRSGNECKCLPPAFKIAENLMDWFPGFVKLSLIANQPSGNAVNSSTLKFLIHPVISRAPSQFILSYEYTMMGPRCQTIFVLYPIWSEFLGYRVKFGSH